MDNSNRSVSSFWETLNQQFLLLDIPLFGSMRMGAPTLLVLVLSITVNAVGLGGGAFVYFPDSGLYVGSAYIFFDEGSFRGVSLFRTPAYTAFLAPLLGLFGKYGVLAMATAQHALTTAIPVFVVKIGNDLDDSRWLGLIAGVMAAFGLQLQSYARLPMTEVLYSFFCILGFLYTLLYLRNGKLWPFLLSIALFSVATLVRPSGKLLPFAVMAVPAAQLLFYRWSFLLTGAEAPTRRRNVFYMIAGIAVYMAILTPWMIRNLMLHDHFGLSPTIGVNLYSNTIEYAGIRDNNSAALADIKARFTENEAARIGRGESPQTEFDWSNHLAAFSSYREATGKSHVATDKVFLQASLDAIKAHPLDYVSFVIRGAYKGFIGIVSAVYYIPGFDSNTYPPSYMPFARDVRDNEIPRNTIAGISSAFIPKNQNPFLWRDPTPLTPIYGWLATRYLNVVGHGHIVFGVFLAGLLAATFLMIRHRNILWLAVLIYLAYTALVPYLIVPISPRHRLAADPIIDVVLALACLQGVIIIRALLPRLSAVLWAVGGQGARAGDGLQSTLRAEPHGQRPLTARIQGLAAITIYSILLIAIFVLFAFFL